MMLKMISDGKNLYSNFVCLLYTEKTSRYQIIHE